MKIILPYLTKKDFASLNTIWTPSRKESVTNHPGASAKTYLMAENDAIIALRCIRRLSPGRGPGFSEPVSWLGIRKSGIRAGSWVLPRKNPKLYYVIYNIHYPAPVSL